MPVARGINYALMSASLLRLPPTGSQCPPGSQGISSSCSLVTLQRSDLRDQAAWASRCEQDGSLLCEGALQCTGWPSLEKPQRAPCDFSLPGRMRAEGARLQVPPTRPGPALACDWQWVLPEGSVNQKPRSDLRWCLDRRPRSQ